MSEIVAIIGASEKKGRFANKAMAALLNEGYEVRLVNPYKDRIEDHRCYSSILEIKEKIDTVTLYVNPTRFKDHLDALIQAQPMRVIMNPGTEDLEMKKVLEEAGIEVVWACTLVMLAAGQF